MGSVHGHRAVAILCLCIAGCVPDRLPGASGSAGALEQTTGGSNGTGDGPVTSGAPMATQIELPETTGDGTDGTGAASTTDPTAGEGGLFCQESCVDDDDCGISGAPEGSILCEGGRCVEQNGCTTDFECVVRFSSWDVPCTQRADCYFPSWQQCVDIGGGVGRCADEPMDLTPCDIFGTMKELMVTPIEGGPPVVVCGTDEWTCVDGECENPCTHDGECKATPEHPVCELDTGVCVCTTDAHCLDTGYLGLVACHAGVCGCITDADCADRSDADVCNGGRCGCSSADACNYTLYDGTTPVCEPEP